MTGAPAARGSPTIAALRRSVARALRAAGLDSPDLDARILLAHALGLDQTALTTKAQQILSADDEHRIDALVRRRLAHEPVARIVGAKEFWGLPLRVTKDVLVPRPDTETVVAAALASIDASGGRERPLRIADLGTGSGALVIALLHELPNARGVATDRSLAALGVARHNAALNTVAERAGFIACDYGDALSNIDVAVANPPYVRSGDIATLAPEVRDHDPRLALDGGADGLAAYRAIARDTRRLLRPGGVLVTEIGFGQADSVTAILAAGGLAAALPRHDLAGVARVLTALNP